MAQMKEQIKTSEKKLANEEIDNLSDIEFKTQVIRMLTELSLVTNEGRNEGYPKWNKAKYTGIQQWREGNWDSNQQFEIKVRNFQLKQNEETRTQKNGRLRNLWHNFKHSNIWIIGLSEGEEEEQGIEKIFEKIMQENFPNLANEIDFQEVQEAQRLP